MKILGCSIAGFGCAAMMSGLSGIFVTAFFGLGFWIIGWKEIPGWLPILSAFFGLLCLAFGEAGKEEKHRFAGTTSEIAVFVTGAFLGVILLQGAIRFYGHSWFQEGNQGWLRLAGTELLASLPCAILMCIGSAISTKGQ